MRSLTGTLILFLLVLTRSLYGQNIGLGKSNPASRLDVNGGIIADSMMILSTIEGSTPLKITYIQQISDQAFTNVAASVGNVSVGAWQSFTAGINGKLINVNLVLANVTEPLIKTLTVYAGEGINGNILTQVQMTIPAIGLNQSSLPSPTLNLPLIAGNKYTVHLDNFSNWAFGSSNGYANGTSSFGENIDFGFSTFMEAGLTDVIKVNNQNGVSVNKLTIGNGATLSKIQDGVIAVGSQPVAVSTKQITILFPSAFTAVPKLYTSIQNESENTVNDYTITIKSLTTTQAVVSVRRIDIPNAGWSENPKLFWTAYE